MSASATTFSTVVREGPWMCSAEMQASISRWRWRCGCAATPARRQLTIRSHGTRLGTWQRRGKRLYTAASLSRTIAAQAPSQRDIMKLHGRPGRWLIILPPLLFLLVFFLIPFAFALKISFAETAARVPPFTDVSDPHRPTTTCSSP